jgi:hypothetical protein
MLQLLLSLLELLDFLTTPIGLALSLWMSFYFCLQALGLNVLIAALLPAISFIELYFLLKQQEY